MRTASCLIRGAAAVLPDRVVDSSELVIRDGLYAELRDASGALVFGTGVADSGGLPVVDGTGMFAVPGLVEMHIHGAFGTGFEMVESGAQLVELAERLAAKGVSAFVPTILWDSAVVGRLSGAILESGLFGTVIPGIHIEGPFVNPERKGGIPLECIADPSPELLSRIIETAKGTLRIMTLAPELPGVEALYPALKAAGVLPSMGHSACALDAAALPDQPFSVTHLFNAMSGIDHRGAGGLANLPFTRRDIWAEINADGVHVNAACLALAARGIDDSRLILTSDAVVPAGLHFGDYRYFGRAVRSGDHGVRYVESGTLIGSNRVGMDIVASFARRSGVPLHRAVRAMSANPAGALGLPARGIMPGGKADLFLWDAGMTTARRG